MTELKTKPTRQNVRAFIDGISDAQQRKGAKALSSLMRRATKADPRMWGASIVGFGRYHYRYATGREGEWFITGFSPRKGYLAVYVLPGLQGHAANLAKLGKYTTGKSCLYIKALEDIRLPVLEAMVRQAVRDLGRPE